MSPICLRYTIEACYAIMMRERPMPVSGTERLVKFAAVIIFDSRKDMAPDINAKSILLTY